jgi:hypothetical protein
MMDGHRKVGAKPLFEESFYAALGAMPRLCPFIAWLSQGIEGQHAREPTSRSMVDMTQMLRGRLGF